MTQSLMHLDHRMNLLIKPTATNFTHEYEKDLKNQLSQLTPAVTILRRPQTSYLGLIKKEVSYLTLLQRLLRGKHQTEYTIQPATI